MECYVLNSWGSSDQTRLRYCGQKNVPKASDDGMRTIFREHGIRSWNAVSEAKPIVTRKSTKRTYPQSFHGSSGAKATLHVYEILWVDEIGL